MEDQVQAVLQALLPSCLLCAPPAPPLPHIACSTLLCGVSSCEGEVMELLKAQALPLVVLWGFPNSSPKKVRSRGEAPKGPHFQSGKQKEWEQRLSRS